MVKKYVYGRPFETYAVVNAENVSHAAESEKREFFREADMKLPESLMVELPGTNRRMGMTRLQCSTESECPTVTWCMDWVRMCEASISEAGCMRASAAMTLTTLSRSVPCMALITSS